MIETWKAWTECFDDCCARGDWQRLAAFLTDDVLYAVAGAPFAVELRGRDAVIAGFARSVANFDAHFDERRWHGIGVREFAPGAITGRAQGWYRKGTLPPLIFSAQSLWLFSGERISAMIDVYDMGEADTMAALGWLAAHGAGLDPSYA